MFGVAFSIVLAHIALGLWLLIWFISLAIGHRRWIRTPLDLPVLIFLGVDLVTGLLGIDPMRSLVHFVSLWHVAIYLLVVNTVRDEVWLRRGLAVLLVTVGLNAGYGLAQYFGDGLYLFRELDSTVRWAEGVNREIGTFSHSMTFAGQMMLVGLMGAALLLWRKRGAPGMRWVIPVVVIFTALAFSYTRSAWLGGALGLITLGFMKGRRTAMGIGVAAVLVVSLIALLQPAYWDRIKSIADPSHPGNRPRIQMARVTFHMFKEDPLFGVGAGNYGKGSELFRRQYGVSNKSHPHNNLYSQIAEKGLLGLGVFICIWWIFFKEAWLARRYAVDDLSRALSSGSLVALIGFHVAGMFESNFGDSEVAMMMWLMVGFAMWARERNQTHFKFKSRTVEMGEGGRAR